MSNLYFAARVALLLNTYGWNQKQFAEAMEIKPQTLNGYMTGHRGVPLELVVKAADYFGVTTDFLLGRVSDTIDKDGRLIIDPR